MEKKVILSIVAIVLVACVLTGVTVAYFMDTEKSTGNVFAAGTLDLVVNNENPWTSKLVELSNMKPGDFGSKDIKVKNDGTINGNTLKFHFENITNASGTTPESEPTPDNGELCANVDVKLIDGTTMLYADKLNAFTSDVNAAGLNGGDERTLKFEYSIPSTVANEIQGDICTFDIFATLTQD